MDTSFPYFDTWRGISKDKIITPKEYGVYLSKKKKHNKRR